MRLELRQLLPAVGGVDAHRVGAAHRRKHVTATAEARNGALLERQLTDQAQVTLGTSSTHS